MNDKPEIEVGKVPIITRFIYTLGNLPTSYLMSMTFQEQVTWLCNYIQATLIPQINEDVEAIQELQNLYELLRTYVNDYFDNLDVQEEINNKLEEMSENGTLTTLIGNYVTPYIDEQNQRISNIDNKVNAVQNGTIAVSSTSQMTDTTKVYVNTTNGKWYYYDNNNWEIGGDYQSSGIGEKTINVLMLEENLQSNFNIDFDDILSSQTSFGGYYKHVLSTNKAVFVSSPQYTSYSFDLDINTIYLFNGFNYGDACGLIVADSEDNVILSTRFDELVYSLVGTSKMFYVTQTGLKAYVSHIPSNITDGLNQMQMLRKINNVYNNLKIKNSISELSTIEDYNMMSSNAVNSMISLSSNNGYTTKAYPINKGTSYKINYKNYLQVRAFIITDLNNVNKIIAPKITDDPQSKYEFTATFDGIAYLTNYSSDLVNASIEIINSFDTENYPLIKNKTICYDGDSITESRLTGNAQNGGAYPKLISDITNSYYINQAVGGATLSLGDGQTSHSVVNNISNLPTNCDCYVFSGGVNDMWQGRPLGVLTSNYTDEVDISTITGALEYIFRYALTNFLGKPIIFVITQKLTNPFYNRYGYTQFNMHDRIVEVCEKYSIPYYDAFNCSGLNGWNTAQKTAYLNANATQEPDGTHPNKNGYLKYYVPQIIQLLNKNFLES